MYYSEKQVFYFATLVVYATLLPSGMGTKAPGVLRTDEQLKEDGLLRNRERKGFVCVIDIPDSYIPVNTEKMTLPPMNFGEKTIYVTDEELEKEGIKVDEKGGIKKKVMDRAKGKLKEGMSVKECRRESWNEVEIVCDREEPPSDTCWDGSRILYSSPENQSWDTRSCHEVALEIEVKRYGSPVDPELICGSNMALGEKTTCDCDHCKKCNNGECGWDWSVRDFTCPYTNECELGSNLHSYDMSWSVDGIVSYTDTDGNSVGDDAMLHFHAWYMRDNRVEDYSYYDDGTFVRTAIKELDLYQRSRFREGHVSLYETSVMEACESQTTVHDPFVHLRGWFEGWIWAWGHGEVLGKNTCPVEVFDDHIEMYGYPKCLLNINIVLHDYDHDPISYESIPVEGSAWGGNGLCHEAILKHVDWTPTTLLGCCQGDCDEDSHCVNGLICHHRDSTSDPGPDACEGTPFSNADYCAGPVLCAGHELDYKGWNPPTPLGCCEGDCDNDDDCEGTLTCYHRDSTSDPGPDDCGGTPFSNADYCV